MNILRSNGRRAISWLKPWKVRGAEILPRVDAERLAHELLDSTSHEKVIDRWIRSGHNPEGVRRTASVIAESPLMPAARLTALRLAARDWQNEQYARLDQFTEIVPNRNELSRDDFLQQFVYTNRPVCIPGAALGWAAVQRWTDDYLKTACGSAEVSVMVGRDGAPAEDQYAGERLSKRMTFGAYIDLIARAGSTNDYYLVAKNDFFASPETGRLLDDIGRLEIVPSVSVADIKLWFGPRGTHTPLHHDSRSTLLVQIRGRKQFTLIPPWYAAQMRQTLHGYAGDARDGRGFKAGPVCTETKELTPGDVLFVPVGWWHEVQSLDVSISISLIELGHFLR